MKRRTLFRILLTAPVLASGALAACRAAPTWQPVLQVSPVAGFQYYRGPAVWQALRRGNELRLIRQPGNPYDERAVEVYWRRFKLGYVPRRENADIARLLDQGISVRARVEQLQESPDPWQRVKMSISPGDSVSRV